MAIHILSSSTLIENYLADVEIFLQKFVESSKDLYEEEMQVSNLHGLKHIADDIKNLTAL